MRVTDAEFKASAKLDAHEKVMADGGPAKKSMGEMVNIGVETGIEFERLRVCSVLRMRAARVGGKLGEELHIIAAQVEDGIT